MASGRTYRSSLAVLALGLALLAVLIPAAPAGARERILAHWKLTLSGTIRHTWSLPDAAACHPTGDGFVTVRFATTHPERITIGDNGYGPGDISWNDEFSNIAGTLTAVDARTENPPPPGQSSCDDTEPVPDTRSCGTYHFHSGLSVDEPPSSGFPGARLTDFGNFTNAAHTRSRRVEDCETGGFVSFAWIGDDPKQIENAEDIKLPGYPTAAQLASRHGRIVISVTQSHRWVPRTLTVRHVRLVFTRVG
jgi:hypothetical protein